jgi:hypothetical protein
LVTELKIEGDSDIFHSKPQNLSTDLRVKLVGRYIEMRQAQALIEDSRRLALRVSQEEADALLHILLNAPPSKEVSEEMMESLLYRVAGVQREFARQCAEERRVPIRRRLVPQRLLRRRVVR